MLCDQCAMCPCRVGAAGAAWPAGRWWEHRAWWEIGSWRPALLPEHKPRVLIDLQPGRALGCPSEGLRKPLLLRSQAAPCPISKGDAAAGLTRLPSRRHFAYSLRPPPPPPLALLDRCSPALFAGFAT